MVSNVEQSGIAHIAMQCNVEQLGIAHIAMWSNHTMHLRVPTGRLPPRCENKLLLSCGQITKVQFTRVRVIVWVYKVTPQ